MKSLITTFAAAALLGVSATAETNKSFRSGEIWPDNNGVHINAHAAGMLFHDGAYYWFGQHMVEGGAGNTAQVGVSVYSSKDLYNWKDEGISLLTDDYLKPAGKYVRIFPLAFNEAPAMFKHKGKYFLFSSGCTGWNPNPARFASADHIFGPWTAHGNPVAGTDAQKSNTFESQSTYVLPVEGKPGAFIFMADRWRPQNAIDARYIWLPVQFNKDGLPFLEWKDEWDLGFFDKVQP